MIEKLGHSSTAYLAARERQGNTGASSADSCIPRGVRVVPSSQALECSGPGNVRRST